MRTLIKIQKKINTDQYCNILIHGLEKNFENLGIVEGERIFQ